MVTATKEQTKAAFLMIAGVAEAIREAGEIPSGTLYSMLIGKVDIEGYGKLIGILKNAGLVSESAHLLKWIGPKVTA